MTSDLSRFEAIRQHASELFETVGISRIVVVDDEYAPSVEELVAHCLQIGNRTLDVPHFGQIDFSTPREVLIDHLRTTWDGLTDGERDETLAFVRAAKSTIGARPDQTYSDEVEHVDTRAAQSLEELLDSIPGCQYITLSLRSWRESSDQLLMDDAAATTMFLFDRDFRREVAGSDQEGIELIRQTQARAVGYCGLISHTVSLGGEYRAWCQLSDENELDRDKFIVISKERLTNQERDYYGFLGMLRLTALNERYGKIKSHVWDIFRESMDRAKECLDQLSVLDFDRMVFESSRIEGVWEPETLSRVFGILMRKETRSRLHLSPSIYSDVSEARRVSSMPKEIATGLKEESGSNEALRIQRFEIYESAEDINKFHGPVELGDIYQTEDNGKSYILLAQPCDLMVRANGKRGYDEKLDRTGALVDIVFSAERRKHSWTELPYYDERTGEAAFVDLARVQQVPLVILDLCVIQSDGQSMINLASNCPDLLIEPWKVRHEQLEKYFRAALKRRARMIESRLGKDIQFLCFPTLPGRVRGKIAISDDTVQYDLRRIRRLRQPWSGAILTAFAQHQARAAFEHPMVRST